ncbi:MAG: heme-binding protein [Acidobacteria bacterium]|nr:heme-binding protein [Acidobacteriota bacterium]
MKKQLLCGLLAVAAMSSSGAELTTVKALNLAVAKEIAAAVEAEGAKNKWTLAIAIVDAGGHLIYLQRADNTQIASIDVAQAKAKSAVGFKRPTKVFEDMVAGGRTAVVKLPVVLPVEGGLPLMAGDVCIGAIGVSGATSAQDGIAAKAGADVFLKIAGGAK